MRETNKSRTNSSAAMVKIIDQFVEDNWLWKTKIKKLN
jgi:hypothetical protein